MQLSLKLIAIMLFFIIIISCKKDDNTTNNPIQAYNQSDLYGTWIRHSLVTSSNNTGYWIHGSESINAATTTLNVTLANGSWDTTYATPSILVSSSGVITATYDAAAHSFLNVNKNLIVGTTKRGQSYTLIVDQKTVPGTIYSASDLQGIWLSHYLVTGGGLWSGWIHSKSTIDNNGNCTVSEVVKSDGNTNTSSAAFSISSSGVISVNGLATYNGFLSPDKQLMLTNLTDGGGGSGLAVSQKLVPGTTYSKADLNGKWQFYNLLVGSENWTEHGIMTIDINGNAVISDVVKDNGDTFINPGIIPMSITSDGVLTFGADFHGFLGADKKTIFATMGDDSGNAYCFLVILKMP